MNIATLGTATPLARRTLAQMSLPPAEVPSIDRVELSAAALQAPAGMETMPEARLPEEAHYMLDLINSGKRMSFTRNGVTFHNREGLLPEHEDGYYREWTVRQRGKTGRGKSRMVTGGGGELYFTANHYKAFRWVVRSEK